jgi:sugar phosphate isomerase/epimerase
MLRGGLSSVSYRNAAPRTVIELAKGAGLRGIEWSADTHAPHGDVKRAEELMMATLRAGLTMPSYGSFYRLGRTDAGQDDFLPVLETACRMQASTIRVWASFESGVSVEAVAGEGRKIAEAAGKHGITICLEPHERSAVSGYRALAEAARLADNPFFKICWTPLPACGNEELRRAAEELSPRLGLIHVRNWTACYDRMALAGSDACWAAVDGMRNCGRSATLDSWAVIEYLADERPETLKREAEALLSRIAAGSRD